MTKQEYNRDVARLWRMVQAGGVDESVIGKEFRRLYYADMEFEYANKKSVLILLRINHRFRFQPLHYFGAFAEVK